MPKFFCFLFLQCLLFSCQKPEKHYPQTLIEVERLSDNEPKKAKLLLEQLKDSLQILDEEQRIYYNLLSLKTKDKLYIRHTSDSLIKNITAFYEKYGDRDKLLESYYYMGRVYRDLGDSPEALKCFQKALDISDGTKRYLLLSKIYSQIATLYDYQEIYEEIIPVLEKSYENILLSGDSMPLALPVRDIARVYNMTGKKDSAVFFYNKAYKLALQSRNIRRASGILTELSAVYRTLGLYDLALKSIQISLQDTIDRDLFPTYASLGRIYLEKFKLDSADFYLKKCLKSDNIYVLAGIYESLSEKEEVQSNFKEAIRYMRLHKEYQDSIKKITATEEIRKFRSLYNYQLREKENQKLIIEHTQAKALFYQIIMVCMITFCIACYFLYRLKRNKSLAEEQAMKLRKEKEIHLKKSLAQIDKNNHKLMELETSLHHEKKYNNTLQLELIQVQKELLALSNRRIELRHTANNLLKTNFSGSDIYIKFHSACHTQIKIGEEDWLCLQKELDLAYENFTARLYELYPRLSLLELRVCFLIKISIKVSDMAIFLGRTKSTISSARNRLYTKLTGKQGTPDLLDQLIVDF